MRLRHFVIMPLALSCAATVRAHVSGTRKTPATFLLSDVARLLFPRIAHGELPDYCTLTDTAVLNAFLKLKTTQAQTYGAQ